MKGTKQKYFIRHLDLTFLGLYIILFSSCCCILFNQLERRKHSREQPQCINRQEGISVECQPPAWRQSALRSEQV